MLTSLFELCAVVLFVWARAPAHVAATHTSCCFPTRAEMCTLLLELCAVLLFAFSVQIFVFAKPKINAKANTSTARPKLPAGQNAGGIPVKSTLSKAPKPGQGTRVGGIVARSERKERPAESAPVTL